MSVDEELRHDVYEALKTTHGAKVARAMMEMLPPAGHPELATKSDLAVLEANLRGDIAGVRGELTGLRGELTSLRGEMTGLQGDVDALRADVAGKIEAQTVRFIRWSAVIAGISLTIAEALSRVD